jgi:hypothetical protein
MKSLLIVLVVILIGVNCISQAVRPLEGTYQSTGNPALNPNLSIENGLLVEKLNQQIDETNSLSKYNNLNKKFIPFKTVGFSIAEIIPRIRFNEQINLTEIRQIKLIDVRSDISKVGFFPVNLALKKNGIKTVGFQIKEGPLKWLTKYFIDTNIITDSTSNRDLVLVLQKCWFSSSANEPYSASNPRLKTNLEYEFDVYTLRNNLYYPQKKIFGTISEQYNEVNGVNLLLDSLLQILKSEVFIKFYAEKEIEKNAISLLDFNNFYNQQLKRYKEISTPKKGVYLTYEDFLNKKILADTLELVKKYDNVGRTNIYASEITAIKNGESTSCNKAWGYSDGMNLFINNSNGFFIRLTQISSNNFIFNDLNSIAFDRIKSPIKNNLMFGKSNYEIIKDYARVTPLTYQLDLTSGMLH